MQIRRYITGMIYSITAEEFLKLENKFEKNQKFECEEKQLYIMEKHTTTEDGGFITTYLALDNSTGEFFIEEFKYEEDAMVWLLDLKASEVLQKAEEEEYWW